MKIVQLFDQTSPLVSGYSMRSRYITESLVQLGIKLIVFSSPIYRYSAKEDSFSGVPYIRTGELRGKLAHLPLLKELKIVSSFTKMINARWDDDVKLIDAHSSVVNGISGLKIARQKKLPFIYEVRAFWEDAAVDQGKAKEGDLRYRLTRHQETSIIQKADKVTVICEGLKNDLLKRGIPEEKITVISNGVDTEQFQPIEGKDSEIVEKYGLKDCKVFGFIGSFFHFEGLEYLVRSAKQIMEKRKDVKYLIVGGGKEEERLHQLVGELKLKNRVIFAGRVRHDDIKKYYSVIDVFVYPRASKRITELVTPLKPLEAMALEKVVIASDVGGLKELVEDGSNGILFKADDVNDLTEKCLYVLDQPSKMETMTKTARQYVIKERNWLNICRRYLDMYKDLGVMS